MTKVNERRPPRGYSFEIRHSSFDIRYLFEDLKSCPVWFPQFQAGRSRSCGLSSLLLRASGPRELRNALLPKALELVMQAAEADSQEFGRPGPVSLNALKRLQDEVSLGIPQAAGPRVRGRRRRRGARRHRPQNLCQVRYEIGRASCRERV